MKKIIYSFSTLVVAMTFATVAFAQNAVQDSSFEAGTPSAVWVEASTNFGTPLCDANCGNCGGPCGSHSGSWYAWFGGVAADEVGSVSQSVNVPSSASTTEISFWFTIAIASGGGADSFAVLVDTDTIFFATDADSTTYGSGYTRLSFNGEAYEGGAHTLKVWSHCTNTAAVSNFLVDDVWFGTAPVTFNDDAASEHLTAYPTPATDDLTIDIELANKQDVKVELVNMNGAVVYTKNLSNIKAGQLTVDVREFASGTYFLNVFKKDGTLTSKVNIQ